MSASLVLSVPVAASAEATFAAAADWAGHDHWMLLTTVVPTRGAGSAVDDEMTAVTGPRLGWRGLGSDRRVGLVDSMRIVAWDPPRRCVVEHTGRIVRGSGAFAVVARSDGSSVFVWSERLELPLGVVGQWAWPLIRPAARAFLQLSLRRFARWAPTVAAAGAAHVGPDDV